MGGSSYKGDDGGSMTSEGRAKAHKTSGMNMKWQIYRIVRVYEGLVLLSS